MAELFLDVLTNVKKARALGGAEPFVAIAAIKITTVIRQIQRNLTGGMRSVNGDHRTVLVR